MNIELLFVAHVVDAPMAEAYTLKEGLMLAQHIGCNRLIIQSDCMKVVETMNGGFSALYDECITIWSGFQEISIEHCSRDANQAAHELAKRAMLLKQNCTWDHEPHSFILAFVNCDKRCNHPQ
jgi:ribonuclease HI